MVYIAIVLILPILYLLIRVYLILNDGMWSEADAKILKFTMVKKSYRGDSESAEDAQNNYIDILYEFSENGKSHKSKRVSLGLIDRQYSKVEIEHDKFLNTIKSGTCKVYYLKNYPNISVIKKNKHDCDSNLMLLSIYIFVVVTSYIIILLIS